MPPRRPRPSSLAALDSALSLMRRPWLQHPERRRRFLAELGVPVELGCVRTLFAVAEAPDPATVAQVAEQLAVDPSTASRLVNDATRAGFIERGTAKRDRRCVNLRLSDAGRDLLDRARAIRRRWLGALTREWSDDDVAQLARLLERLRHELDREETP